MTGRALTHAEAAAWIRDEVIGSYHWAEWRTDWLDSIPANERNPGCEPGYVPETPYSDEVCFHQKPVCTLVGPGRRSDGSWRGYRVWLAQPPAAGPPPFTAERAAWIRENVLPPGMRCIRPLCRCTEPRTLCHYCAGRASEPRHGQGDGVEVTPETWLYNQGGNPWGAGRGGRTICVWLVDRTCRRVCPCSCHTAPPRPEPAAPVQLDLDLFAEVMPA